MELAQACSNYRSLAKECLSAEHFTSLPKKGGMGTFSSVFVLNHEEHPCHVHNDSMLPKQIIGQTELPAASKSSPDGTQHSEQHHATVSIMQLTEHTALATSVLHKATS